LGHNKILNTIFPCTVNILFLLIGFFFFSSCSQQEGDKIPSADLFEDSPANKVNIADLCAGKKVILFAVPGAFTPGCSKTHLPGYVDQADALKKGGVAEIVCVSVNDPFVMSAWGKQVRFPKYHFKKNKNITFTFYLQLNTTGKIRMLADPAAAFAKQLELSVDLPPLGGVRSKRYSMVIEDGVIKQLNVEPDGTGLTCSLADKIKL
jgi:peroxiredoxin 5